MSVRIHLDDPHAFYTNLDFISGRIILYLSREDDVSAILVKLEGESKSRIARPADPPDTRVQYAQENHKILYKVQQVFPSTDIATGTPSGYTLRPGQHEYPFRFKFPFNNGCATYTKSFGFAGIRLMDLPDQSPYKHVTKTLPPSLNGFSMEAEIRYYVKVTVQRPSLWKGNRRSEVGLKFMPIEPIRPRPSNAETFARRPHIFQAGLSPFTRKQSMFKKKPTQMSNNPPSVLVDARLPSPAILTCNEPIPLRILLKKQSESPEYVFLVGLQIDLIGHTKLRALQLVKTETSTWVVMSLGGLSIPIGNPADPVGTESPIDRKTWDRIPLPHTVTPSFNTCNISRVYELQVTVTLGYGFPGEIQPQTQGIPLRFPVTVYSGIKPPPALLEAMASRPTPPSPGLARPSSMSAASASRPPTTNNNNNSDPLYPPQLSTPGAAPIDDAPPSYEDAMADEIGPVDGPRRDYSGMTNENAPSEFDEGGGGGGGSGGEKSGNWGRLFPGSGPGPRPGSGNSGF